MARPDTKFKTVHGSENGRYTLTVPGDISKILVSKDFQDDLIKLRKLASDRPYSDPIVLDNHVFGPVKIYKDTTPYDIACQALTNNAEKLIEARDLPDKSAKGLDKDMSDVAIRNTPMYAGILKDFLYQSALITPAFKQRTAGSWAGSTEESRLR